MFAEESLVNANVNPINRDNLPSDVFDPLPQVTTALVSSNSSQRVTAMLNNNKDPVNRPPPAMNFGKP
ncbi:hypothetical protein DVH24_035952 [Malus domestica]|uniref:Uncharacterized protein n=1 Tax=Malus domestica TaxID=3750 RepID=A0A498JTY8_MALDO|nr:hypothetical protein DVH24_035952 [Malus domestica]